MSSTKSARLELPCKTLLSSYASNPIGRVSRRVSFSLRKMSQATGKSVPHQELGEQSAVGQKSCIRRCEPLVVANGSANAGGNQARGKGAHAGYQHVVFCPCEFFNRPERDNVTN